MGLTIHWSLSAPENFTDEQASELVAQLRSGFLDLPFEHVGEILHLSAEEIESQIDDRESPDRWLLITAQAKVKLGNDPDVYDYVRVTPDKLIGFVADPGAEAEAVCLFLARYPETTLVNGRTVQTRLKGWQGSAFCKTQYGGIVSNEHFIKCHLTVIAGLDLAQSLGLKAEVLDVGKLGTSPHCSKNCTSGMKPLPRLSEPSGMPTAARSKLQSKITRSSSG